MSIHISMTINGKNITEVVKRAVKEVREEVRIIRERDPAARSDAEVLLTYSGLHALLAYRASHALHKSGHKLAARMVSQGARAVTGIEIHPGAEIGRGLFIDHGMGVVIGETAEIGDNCTIYQGVTLGGTGKDTGKRHPTLGDNVMVGAGAKVLGPFKVGNGAKIAAGAVVLKEVPAESTAVGIPARVVSKSGERKSGERFTNCPECADLDQVHIPDPVAQELCKLRLEQAKLKEELEALKAVCVQTSDENHAE